MSRVFLVDRSRGVLVVKKGAIVTKNIKFNGKVVTGMYCSFFGDIEAEEVYLAKGCAVGGTVRCEKAVIGAESEFNSIIADYVLILKGCKGRKVYSEGDVRILGGCEIGEIYAGRNLLIEGNSKIEKMEARKILAFQY
jgi:cytoskeletal protein CcmA (bactofilin family)